MSEVGQFRSSDGSAASADDRNERRSGFVVDLDGLEEQAESLYLHRFVEYVRKVRGDHGRYLTLRAGDDLAIRAAGDGSSETLDELIVEQPPIDT